MEIKLLWVTLKILIKIRCETKKKKKTLIKSNFQLKTIERPNIQLSNYQDYEHSSANLISMSALFYRFLKIKIGGWLNHRIIGNITPQARNSPTNSSRLYSLIT